MSADHILRIENLEEFSRLLAKENLRLMKDTGNPLGEEYTQAIVSSFLTHLVDSVITDALYEHNDNKSLSREQLYQKVERSLNVAKNLVQNSVADGFSKALTKWTKQTQEYYCVVKPSPPPVNKLAC